MMRCDECDVDFSGNLVRCPLCGTDLIGSPSPAVFPVHAIQRTSKRARRLLAAATLCFLVVAIIGGCAIEASVLSIVALCATILLAYVFVRNLILYTPDVLRITERYFLVLLCVCGLAFIATRNTVAATYVIPVISVTAILFNTVLLVVQRGAFVTGYAKYLFYNIILGVAPLALVATGMTEQPIPAILSAVAAVILALLVVIIARRQTIDEARKLFSA